MISNIIVERGGLGGGSGWVTVSGGVHYSFLFVWAPLPLCPLTVDVGALVFIYVVCVLSRGYIVLMFVWCLPKWPDMLFVIANFGLIIIRAHKTNEMVLASLAITNYRTVVPWLEN